jgi:hypothetical protein
LSGCFEIASFQERLVTRFIQLAIFRGTKFSRSELKQVERMAKAALGSAELPTRYGFNPLEPKLGRQWLDIILHLLRLA